MTSIHVKYKTLIAEEDCHRWQRLEILVDKDIYQLMSRFDGKRLDVRDSETQTDPIGDHTIGGQQVMTDINSNDNSLSF